MLPNILRFIFISWVLELDVVNINKSSKLYLNSNFFLYFNILIYFTHVLNSYQNVNCIVN